MPDQTAFLNPYHKHDKNVQEHVKPHWKQAASGHLQSVPEGFGDVLRYFEFLFAMESKQINTSLA